MRQLLAFLVVLLIAFATPVRAIDVPAPSDYVHATNILNVADDTTPTNFVHITNLPPQAAASQTTNGIIYYNGTNLVSGLKLTWDTNIMKINQNAVALPAAPAGTILQLGNVDGTGTRIQMEAFANQPQVTMRRANGTGALPSAVTLNDTLGTVGFIGYGGTTYGGQRGAFACFASETWTDTQQGAYCAWSTTPTGGIIVQQKMRLNGSGNLSIGNSNDSYALDVTGDINTSGIYRVGGTQIGFTNLTGTATAAQIPATPLATGTSVSLTAPRQYYVCTGTCTVTPPVPAAGYEFCVLNDDNVATVITFAAIGSSAMYERTARTSYGTAGTGTFISGGAVGDKMCLLGRDSTHYLVASSVGTWTSN